MLVGWLTGSLVGRLVGWSIGVSISQPVRGLVQHHVQRAGAVKARGRIGQSVSLAAPPRLTDLVRHRGSVPHADPRDGRLQPQLAQVALEHEALDGAGHPPHARAEVEIDGARGLAAQLVPTRGRDVECAYHLDNPE